MRPNVALLGLALMAQPAQSTESPYPPGSVGACIYYSPGPIVSCGDAYWCNGLWCGNNMANILTSDPRDVVSPLAPGIIAVPDPPITIPLTHCPPDRVQIQTINPNGLLETKCLPAVLLTDPEQ